MAVHSGRPWRQHTMLTRVLHFEGSSPALSLIARELALEVAEAAYRPLLAEHIPGAANVAADALSRLHAPGGHYKLPGELRTLQQSPVEARPREWYRSFGQPDGPPAAKWRQLGAE